jgi:putative spermidine/putrescine transport system ATP-binding protein
MSNQELRPSPTRSSKLGPSHRADRPEHPLVRLEGVQKSYDGEELVVKGLDLEIAAGEFLTLLGPSGSGKTTTLMMLAGFEAPTTGTIWLGERKLNNLPPHKRGIGVVFQNYALFPHMTIAENIGYPLKVRRMAKPEILERVNRALDMVQLGGLGQRRPGQLSGGQQQRVALARALVFEPQLVLMDEPLGALDRQLREQMQIEIKHLHDRLNVTIVYVTHDQGEALTMSDRVAVFNDGVIQQIDAPGELYENPCNSFVAGFVGENNALDGVVTEIEGEHCVVTLDSGARVLARPINVDAPGAQTTLSIRPERVSLSEVAPASDTTASDVAVMNRFEGEILEQFYLGDHTRIRVRVIGRDNFIVKLPIWARGAHFKPGDTVTVTWAAADCRALDPIIG